MISFDAYKGPACVEDPAGTTPFGLEGYVPRLHGLCGLAWRRPGPHGILFTLAHALAALPWPTRTAPPALRGTQVCARGRLGGTRGCCGTRGAVRHKRWRSSGISSLEIISCVDC